MEPTQREHSSTPESVPHEPFSSLVGHVKDLVMDLESLIQDLMSGPSTRSWSRRGPSRPGRGRAEREHSTQRRGPRP